MAILNIGPSQKRGRPEDYRALGQLARESGRATWEVVLDLEIGRLVLLVSDCGGCGAPFDGRWAFLGEEAISKLRPAPEGAAEDHLSGDELDRFAADPVDVYWSSNSRRCWSCREP